jgi:hypothetical protein
VTPFSGLLSLTVRTIHRAMQACVTTSRCWPRRYQGFQAHFPDLIELASSLISPFLLSSSTSSIIILYRALLALRLSALAQPYYFAIPSAWPHCFSPAKFDSACLPIASSLLCSQSPSLPWPQLNIRMRPIHPRRTIHRLTA